MKVEYDEENSEIILRLGIVDRAEILFALDMASIYSKNPQQKRKSQAMHAQLIASAVTMKTTKENKNG